MQIYLEGRNRSIDRQGGYMQKRKKKIFSSKKTCRKKLCNVRPLYFPQSCRDIQPLQNVLA